MGSDIQKPMEFTFDGAQIVVKSIYKR